jgi:hypothetical protein
MGSLPPTDRSVQGFSIDITKPKWDETEKGVSGTNTRLAKMLYFWGSRNILTGNKQQLGIAPPILSTASLLEIYLVKFRVSGFKSRGNLPILLPTQRHCHCCLRQMGI